MAFRNMAYWKTMVNNLRQRSNEFTTSTSPKLKAYSQTLDGSVPSQKGGFLSQKPKGDIIAVCVALGMIGMAASFGLYTALHQLGRAPNVLVKKSRRETLPEVVEPEHVAEDAEKFLKQSFFRKVAHIQDSDRHDIVPNPIRGDVFTRPVRVETLKDVGVDTVPH